MTAEEVRKKIAPFLHGGKDTRQEDDSFIEVYSVLLEYARQEAILFAEWAHRSYEFSNIYINGEWKERWTDYNNSAEYTTDELYDIFEEQNKSKI